MDGQAHWITLVVVVGGWISLFAIGTLIARLPAERPEPHRVRVRR